MSQCFWMAVYGCAVFYITFFMIGLAVAGFVYYATKGKE